MKPLKINVIVFGIKEHGETQRIINMNIAWGVMI